MRGSRRGVYERHGLADDLAAADDPVQRVLERTGHTMRVLRTGNQDGFGGFELRPELHDRRGRLVAVEIGVERRQFCELGVDPDLDAVRRQLGGGLNKRRVR